MTVDFYWAKMLRASMGTEAKNQHLIGWFVGAMDTWFCHIQHDMGTFFAKPTRYCGKCSYTLGKLPYLWKTTILNSKTHYKWPISVFTRGYVVSQFCACVYLAEVLEPNTVNAWYLLVYYYYHFILHFWQVVICCSQLHHYPNIQW